MREIEFRGRKEGIWFYGNLIKAEPIKDYKGYTWEYGIHTPSIFDNTAHLNWNLDVKYVETDTVGQYTGLKDKNGKKIYEGDIIKLDSFNPPLFVVDFVEGAFCLKQDDYGYYTDIHYVQHAGINQAEVIGNIHDNPELIKKGE